jgi:hypothetical protein
VHFLKKQRINESLNYLSSYVENEADPASTNDELNEKLQQNKEKGDKKLQSIFIKYEEKEKLLLNNEEQQSSESCNSNYESKQDEKTDEINTFNKNEISQEKRDALEKSLQSILNNSKEKEHLFSKDENQPTLISCDSHNENKDAKKYETNIHKDKQSLIDILEENEQIQDKEDLVEKNLEKLFQNCEQKEQVLLSDSKQQNLENPNSENNNKPKDKQCKTNTLKDKIKEITIFDRDEESEEKVDSRKEASYEENKNKNSLELHSVCGKDNFEEQDQKINDTDKNIICEKVNSLKNELNQSILTKFNVFNKTDDINNILENKASLAAEEVKVIEILSDEDENILNNKDLINFKSNCSDKELKNISNRNKVIEKQSTDVESNSKPEIEILKTNKKKNMTTVNNKLLKDKDTTITPEIILLPVSKNTVINEGININISMNDYKCIYCYTSIFYYTNKLLLF